jgi:protein-tyrosine phosphatase
MIRQRTRELQRALDREGIALTVLPGADVRIEPELVAKIRAGAVLTLADGGRYVLLEMPHDLHLPIDRLLAELTSAGLLGILSHPERNQAILRQPSLAKHRAHAFGKLEIDSIIELVKQGPSID